VGLIVLLVLAAALIDDPLRGYLERNVNEKIEGSHLQIGALDLHPLTLSVELEHVVVRQTAEPEPPILLLPSWQASLQWRELVRGHVVSDHLLEQPRIHFTRVQAKEEAKDPRTKPWQDALQEVYPVTINQLRIRDADVTYFDHPKARPVHLNHLNLELDHISNRQTEKPYPSEIRLDTTVFEGGHLNLTGGINFLLKPVLGVKADVALDDVPLRDVVALTGRYNVQLTHGTLAAHGQMEYAPTAKTVALRDVLIDGLKADYVY
jgi:hypothetical protein